jgi:hypothetical protein
MVEAASVRLNLNSAEETLRKAIEKGLATSQIKKDIKAIASNEITAVVINNQALFRPDIGPGGGNELVGQLGIGEQQPGQEGRALTERYAGSDAAWTLLKPGSAAAKVKTFFRRARAGKFAEVLYEIDLDRFFNNFRSVYIGSSNLRVSWMQNLIDGVPTAQEVEFPEGITGYAFVDSGPDFSATRSRTGFGHMVGLERLKIPAQQFVFNGRGRGDTFGKLLTDIERRLRTNSFKNKLEVRIAKSINSGG